MANKKTVGIVGGGPGGLMSAMLLSSKGFDVTLYERSEKVGGRCGKIEKGQYSWDIGPTFLMYKELLDECFHQAGESLDKELDLIKLDPMYKLFFHDKVLSMSSDEKKMSDELEKHFPNSRNSFKKFRKQEKKRFESLKPILKKDFSKVSNYLSYDGLRALPNLGIGSSVFDRLSSCFKDEDLSLSFSFQSKYLGMSAWECPSMFSIIPHLEHEYGIYHVMGGLHKINEAMRKISESNGAKINTGMPVREIIVIDGQARGICLDDGYIREFDHVIINADFAFSMKNLIRDKFLKKYKHNRVNNMKYSCSTFMLYLGLKGKLSLPFHSIVFAKNYKENIRDIFNNGILSKDISFYIRNSSIIDSSCAPEGNSALYVLVPVPNLKHYQEWDFTKSDFREQVLDQIESRLLIKDIRQRIEEEIVFTPEDWQNKLNVEFGATFNLSHNWDQLAMFRPKNAFNDIDSLYLVGGGTHPGSGLPTIYESGRIATKLIMEREGKNYDA